MDELELYYLIRHSPEETEVTEDECADTSSTQSDNPTDRQENDELPAKKSRPNSHLRIADFDDLVLDEGDPEMDDEIEIFEDISTTLQNR